MYALEFSPSARRDLNKLENRVRREEFEHLRYVIKELARSPRPSGVKKIEGREGAYRIRVGDYRVIYRVYDADRLVVVLQVVRRNEATYRVKEVPSNYQE